MRTMLLVDGHNLLMRAIFATKYRYRGIDEGSAEFLSTGAVNLFTAMMSRVVRETQPERLVVCWDHEGPSWRDEVSSVYKGTRARSIDPNARGTAFDLASRVLWWSSIPQLAQPGFEADDLIGAYWREVAPEHADQLLIVSNDNDFVQLVGPNPHAVSCLRLSPHGDLARTGVDEVRTRWGCTPERVPLIKAMSGDTSDNVIGLHRVGRKTALKRLEKAAWSLGAALHTETLQDAQRVVMNQTLVDLRNPPPHALAVQVPTPWKAPALGSAFTVNLADLFGRLDLQRHREHVLSGALWGVGGDYSGWGPVADLSSPQSG